MRTDLLLRSFALGSASGLRTMTAPATVFRAKRWRVVLPLMALGEYVVDLLPRTGARTAIGPLAARAMSGGLCGATVAIDGGGNAALCAAAGMTGAVGAAYAGLALREWSMARIGPIAAALLEDAVAIVIASLALRGR
jgi:uncharacterized membrane protein